MIREKLDHLEQIAGRILDFGKSREALAQDLFFKGNYTGRVTIGSPQTRTVSSKTGCKRVRRGINGFC